VETPSAGQWWILREANEVVASGSRFWGFPIVLTIKKNIFVFSHYKFLIHHIGFDVQLVI